MSTPFKQVVKIGNAADYPWVDQFSSRVEAWHPHEVRAVEPIMDDPRDEFGRPIKPPVGMEAKDKNGKVIPSVKRIVVKQGCGIEDIVKLLVDGREGSPLFVVDGTPDDVTREQQAKHRNLEWQLAKDRETMDLWRAFVHRTLQAGGTTPAMSQVVWEADQRLVRYGAMASLKMRRFMCTPDGATYDYYEDAVEHLVNPARYGVKYQDDAAKHITDTQSHLPRPVKFEGSKPIALPTAPAGRTYSPATVAMISAAGEAGVELPTDLLDRLESGDAGAIKEAMEALLAASVEAENATPARRSRTKKQESAEVPAS